MILSRTSDIKRAKTHLGTEEGGTERN